MKRTAFFGEDRALDAPRSHINVADKKYNLGVSDLNRIQLVKLGWRDEVLILPQSWRRSRFDKARDRGKNLQIE